MHANGRKIVIIGGGIAGLCAAVYGLKCGYEVEVLEAHDMAGGLAMSWQRGAYRFETCLHWLLGSKPGGEMHAQWQEIFDVDRLTFVDGEEFVRMETEDGDSLSIFLDPSEQGYFAHAAGSEATLPATNFAVLHPPLILQPHSGCLLRTSLLASWA